MNNNHLLATEKMYRPLAEDGFIATQTAFFKRQLSAYFKQSTRQKWEWVLTRLSDLLPPNDKRQLFQFKLSREKIKTSNAHVLSLKQCLHYFESIYFLHQTDDPVFQLNARAKSEMLSFRSLPLAPCVEWPLKKVRPLATSTIKRYSHRSLFPTEYHPLFSAPL